MPAPQINEKESLMQLLFKVKGNSFNVNDDYHIPGNISKFRV